MRQLQCLCVVVIMCVFSALPSSADRNLEMRSFEETPAVSASETPADRTFFDDLSARESFPAWEHFVPGWRRNFQDRYHIRNDSGPAGFTFSEEFRPECEPVGPPVEIRSREIILPPMSPEDLEIRLNETSFILLRESGVPEEVILAVARLKGMTFGNEALFAKALLGAIGQENLQEFQEVLLQNSYVDKHLNSPRTLTYLRKIAERDDSKQWEAWNASSLSQKKNSKSISGENIGSEKTRAAGGSEQGYKESRLLQFRVFCDKWGLPRPKNILLLLLLFYLTTSLIKSFVRANQ